MPIKFIYKIKTSPHNIRKADRLGTYNNEQHE